MVMEVFSSQAKEHQQRHLPLMSTLIDVDLLGSGVRASASFQKIPRLVGRLWSEPHFVGRVGSRERDFKKFVLSWVG